MLGALLALASAATFGLNNAALRRGVLTGGVLQAMAITVPLGVPLFLLACIAFGGLDSLAGFSQSSMFWLALAGVVHFVVGRYGNYRATQALGATLSSPLHQLSVPIAVVLALLFLDEVLTPLRMIGFVLVMIGPLMAAHRPTKMKFEPRLGEGYLWGTVSAIGYGCSPLFIVYGLGINPTLVDSLAAGFVSYSAAALIVIAAVAIAGGFAYMHTLDRTARNWFAMSGVFVFISQMLRYMALAVAPVTIVVPIQRLSAVFRVIFSWIFNRDHEIFTARVLISIAISVLGAIALTLSTEIVLSLLPSEWAKILSFEWP